MLHELEAEDACRRDYGNADKQSGGGGGGEACGTSAVVTSLTLDCSGPVTGRSFSLVRSLALALSLPPPSPSTSVRALSQVGQKRAALHSILSAVSGTWSGPVFIGLTGCYAATHRYRPLRALQQRMSTSSLCLLT